MACPFFEPQFVIETGPWTHRPRLPLGEAFGGVCRAASEPFAPAGEQLDCCNQGYARGVCENFPASCAADAVRFSVISSEPLRLMYILEKDQAPLEHREIDPREIDSERDASSAVLKSQVRAFVSSYLEARGASSVSDRRAAGASPSSS